MTFVYFNLFAVSLFGPNYSFGQIIDSLIDGRVCR